MRRLIDANADINRVDSEGRTALMAAAYMGHGEIVQMLIAMNANVHIIDVDGCSALHLAAVCSTTAVVDQQCLVVNVLIDGKYISRCRR